MKLVPIEDLIKGQRLLIVDDSVVRGTQMRDTVGYLYQSGAKAVHIRPACPPLVFGCKYLNFSRSVSIEDLIARRVIKEREGTPEPCAQKLAPYLDPDSRPYGEMQKRICEMIGVDTLRYQRLDGCLMPSAFQNVIYAPIAGAAANNPLYIDCGPCGLLGTDSKRGTCA